jgi:hypothetical protein
MVCIRKFDRFLTFLIDKEKLYEIKDSFYNQQLTRNKEISVLRDKLRWCYRREGVNYLQNCRELTLEYLQVLRSGFLTHFKAPTSTIPQDIKGNDD